MSRALQILAFVALAATLSSHANAQPQRRAVGCEQLGAVAKAPSQRWKHDSGFVSGTAPGFPIGIADSGIDEGRLGLSEPALTAWSNSKRVDLIGHGTAVASLIAADRADVDVLGVARGARLLSTQIATDASSCASSAFQRAMANAFRGFARDGALIVNVSATTKAASPDLRRALHALQLTGALIVAAGEGGFPANEPGVLGVGELGHFPRDPTADLVAPATDLPVIASSAVTPQETTQTASGGSSFAAPLVTGGAALVWSSHPAWNAAEVTNALARGAHGRQLDIRAALALPLLADQNEPDDWYAAARERVIRPPFAVRGALGYAGDTIDGYALNLAKSQTVTVTTTAGVATALIAPGQARAFTALRVIGGSRLRVRVGRRGRYVIALSRRRGRGAYRLSVRVS